MQSTTAEYVDIITTGGTVVIDLRANVAEGYLDTEPETTGDAIEMIRTTVRSDLPLIAESGWPVLIERRSVAAYAYRGIFDNTHNV